MVTSFLFGRNATFARGETRFGLRKANIEDWNLTQKEKDVRSLCDKRPFLNTNYILDTTAEAVQKAVRTVTLIFVIKCLSLCVFAWNIQGNRYRDFYHEGLIATHDLCCISTKLFYDCWE